MANGINVTETFFAMREKQRANLMKAFGDEAKEIKKAQEDSDIVKSLQSNNPFQVEAAREDLIKSNEYGELEKSDILDAISYSSEIKIIKTGKEIKDNIKTKILPTKQAQYNTKSSEATELLKECGDAPTSEPKPWMLRGMSVSIPYKVYDWDETYYRSADDEACCGGCVCDSLNVIGKKPCKKNIPCDAEQGEARQKYNRAVEIICEISVDIKALELLNNNLSDSQSITLTPRQAILFGFE